MIIAVQLDQPIDVAIPMFWQTTEPQSENQNRTSSPVNAVLCDTLYADNAEVLAILGKGNFKTTWWCYDTSESTSFTPK